MVAAALTWLLTGDIVSDPEGALPGLYTLAMVGAFGGFALSMVNSFKRVVSPGLVLAYAALQGVFVGAFSKVLEAQFGGGLVIGAVVGTMAAVAGTPSLTVPMGESHGLPLGLAFMGRAYSEADLLAMGFAFEQKTKARTVPGYKPTLQD